MAIFGVELIVGWGARVAGAGGYFGDVDLGQGLRGGGGPG